MSLINSGEIGKYDYSFKMIVIGDAGVGKSCLTNRQQKKNFYQIILQQLVLNF